MNIIFITIDSLRADFVGVNGNDWIRTPNLDRFAKNGVLFKRAYPESIPTLQVRRALFTGRRCYPFTDWEFDPKLPNPGWVPIPNEQKVLAEILSENGYQTALVTDVFHTFRPKMNFHRGFDEWHWIRGQECDRFHMGRTQSIPDWKQHVTPKMDLGARKVTELKMYLRNVAFRQSEEDYFSPQVFRRATRWIEENYDAENFFLYIDSFDPHEPWDPPQYYRDMYDPGYNGIEVLNPDYVEDYTTYLMDDELNHMRRALYAGEVTMVDTWLGYFLNKVYQLGLHENTMIIIMSDHGHQLGDNGYVGKHNTGLYPCLMDLFLAIQHPDGIGKGSAIESLVYNHDLYPTMFESLGLDIPEWADGKSLIPLMVGKEDKLRDYVTSMFKNYTWTRDEAYTFFCRSDKTDFRLYDNEKDPAQSNNIAADHPDICEAMWNRILKDGGGEIPFWELGPISRNIPP